MDCVGYRFKKPKEFINHFISVRDPDGTKKYGESLQDKSVTTLSDLLELAGKDGRSPIISLTS